VRFDRVEDEGARRQIEELTRGWEDRSEYFVDTLARGIAKIAAMAPGPLPAASCATPMVLTAVQQRTEQSAPSQGRSS